MNSPMHLHAWNAFAWFAAIGLAISAAHYIAEGIPACIDQIRTQKKQASQDRTPELLKILLSYGAHAKSVTPVLEEIAETFDKGEENFPKNLSVQNADDVRKAIAQIEAATDNSQLRLRWNSPA